MTLPRPRTAALAVGGLALTAALVLAAPLAASAHVHVDPVQAQAGADHVDLVFEVPNEIPSASTTTVALAFPASLRSVEPASVRGWRIAAGTATGARTVTWTATGGGIGARQTQTFAVRVGPVPSVASLPIPATQTYSDGTVVRWDERTPASGAEPEHPAPTLYVQDRAPVDPDDGATGGDVHDAGADVGPVGTVAVVLASAALLVALAGVVLAVLALLRSRRRARP